MPGTYEKIASTTLGSSSSTISFSSIVDTWTDLRLVILCQNANSAYNVNLRFNSDSGNNYLLTRLYANGSGFGTTRTNTTHAQLSYYGMAYQANSNWSFISVDVFNYKNTNVKKSFIVDTPEKYGGSGYTSKSMGLWNSTAAINEVNFILSGGNFATGTQATIYGIKAAE